MDQHLKVKEKSGESTREQALLTGDIRLDSCRQTGSLYLSLTLTDASLVAYVLA